MSSWEYQLSLHIAKVLVIFISIFAGVLRAITLILYRLKKQIYKLVLIAMAVNMVMMFQGVAIAPKTTHAVNGYAPVAKPVTQHDQIVDYIYQRFGPDADLFLNILSCENHKLNPTAQNYNSDGSVDVGIAQINSVHGVPRAYLYDWHTNVDIAYQIFKDSGPSAWTCYKYGLIK